MDSICTPDQPLQLSFPEQTPLKLFLWLDPSTSGLRYRVEREDTVLISESAIGLKLSDGKDLTRNLIFLGSEQTSVEEHFTLPSGKCQEYRHQARQLSLSLEKEGFQFHAVFQIFAQGFAFRLEFPDPVDVVEETAEVHLLQVTHGYGQEHTYIGPQGVKDRQNNESMQEIIAAADLPARPWFMPLLLELKENRGWAWLSEGSLAEVEGPAYTASHFRFREDGSLLFEHDEAHGPELPVQGVSRTPWRICLLSTDLAPIVESTIVENLADPTIEGDFSYVQGGRVAWPWLTDHEWGNGTLEGMKTYIDLARDAGWEYFGLDVGWHAFEETWVPEVIEYAKAQGVKIILWYEYKRLKDLPGTEATFQKIAPWGVAGVKIDFVFDDIQEVQSYIVGALRLGAKYRLMVNFHGITKPVGYRRTWPNLVSREAVKGHEWYKNNAEDPERHQFCPGPRHFCILPFNRSVCGPMDETPVMLDPRARKFITAAHDIALVVLFETGLQHHGSHHQALRDCPALPFLQACPATWEETRLIGGFPGEWVLLARRNGRDWFVGGITVEEREFQVPFDFLSENTSYTYALYRDGGTRESIVVSSGPCQSLDTLTIPAAKDGGFALHIRAL